MPAKGFGGIGIFPGKGTREINLPISISQVFLMKLLNRFNLVFHERMKGLREEGCAVLTALGGSNVNKLALKIKIANAQADTFH